MERERASAQKIRHQAQFMLIENPKAIRRFTDQTDYFFNHSRLSEAGQTEKWTLETGLHSAVLTYLYPTYYLIYQFIERSTM